MSDRSKKLESLLWSIALPGFAQILNKNYIKGFLFVGLEIFVNIKSHFNYVILLSFNGDIREAAAYVNYDWLMFYPCLYFFAMWDAWKDAGGARKEYGFLPFVFSAYFVTVGLIYSKDTVLFGVLWGPVWLPMLFVIPGVLVGFILQQFLRRNT